MTSSWRIAESPCPASYYDETRILFGVRGVELDRLVVDESTGEAARPVSIQIGTADAKPRSVRTGETPRPVRARDRAALRAQIGEASPFRSPATSPSR
jgi:hypothetical protein